VELANNAVAKFQEKYSYIAFFWSIYGINTKCLQVCCNDSWFLEWCRLPKLKL